MSLDDAIERLDLRRLTEMAAEGKQPVRNPDFVQLLDEMKDLHDRKSADYAQDANVYSNFEYAAKVSEPFTDPVDTVFATMIGIKLARIAQLKQKGRVPKNEPLVDSFRDLTIYCGIWCSYHMMKARTGRL